MKTQSSIEIMPIQLRELQTNAEHAMLSIRSKMNDCLINTIQTISEQTIVAAKTMETECKDENSSPSSEDSTTDEIEVSTESELTV